jgi:hypothetical protein
MFRTILSSDQANSGKNIEINKQSHVKFWFDRKKYGAVPYLFSCNQILFIAEQTIEIKKYKKNVFDIYVYEVA